MVRKGWFGMDLGKMYLEEIDLNDKYKNRIQRMILFALLFSQLIFFSCKSVNKNPSNEKYFDEHLLKFERITDEQVLSLTDNKTLRHFDALFHGNQIEYNDRNGMTFLWYPKNKSLVVGLYKIKSNRAICFNYSGNVKNEANGDVGGVWNCQPLVLYLNTVVEVKNGNVFHFDDSKKVPFILNGFPEATIESLQEMAK